ncbi:DNA-binding protein, YbaB/EbfC family [Clostridium sp. M62/1]|nr:DNA-binding protein, YbaB/EbfC family [Clostridium sp. M62/1]
MNLQSAEQNAEDKIKQTKYKRQKLKIRRKNTMAKRGGFPGGMPGNMTNLMKQAQRMQRQMEETTKELEEKEYTASAGGGAVTVTVSGKKEVLSVKLSPEVVDPDDIEMLEDLIVAATNEAFRQMEDASSQAMAKLTGGLGGLGGGLGGGFPF